MSCSRDGELSLSATKGLEFKGKWWISGDRFHFKILGERGYFLIVQEGNTIRLFDPTGTLFGKFNLSANQLRLRKSQLLISVCGKMKAQDFSLYR